MLKEETFRDVGERWRLDNRYLIITHEQHEKRNKTQIFDIVMNRMPTTRRAHTPANLKL